ncbi:MAG: hypothetical protein ACTHMS_07610 [Jatrophihabitans sp.]|uniref:hypothetical protein n=1 Tax=Jatrophihabitans sp. TaxID=1932789 RepID=UPI003F7E9550
MSEAVARWPMRPTINLAAEWQRWWDAAAEEIRDRPGGDAAVRQGFVLTTRQLRRALGWTDNDLRRERRRGTWWSPARGTASPLVIEGDDWLSRRRRHVLSAVAVALTHPERRIGTRSAAIVHGLPTLGIPDDPELTAPDDPTFGRHGAARSFRAAFTAEDETTWFGVPLLTPARTVVDLARHDRFDGIMAADAALRDGLTTRLGLMAPLRAGAGWPGIRQARGIVGVASPKAESPLESVTRLRMIDDRFPQIAEQHPFCDPLTGLVEYVDFLVAGRLVVETDGGDKYVGDALLREKQRENRLRRHPVAIERVMADDVYRGWHLTSQRLRAHLRPW